MLISHNLASELNLDLITACESITPTYCIGAEETGEENGYKHCHIVLECKNAKSFQTIQKAFPKMHIEKRCGSILQAKKYATKNGVFLDNLKVSDSDIAKQVIDDLIGGLTVKDILLKYPNYVVKNIGNLQKIAHVLSIDKRSGGNDSAALVLYESLM